MKRISLVAFILLLPLLFACSKGGSDNMNNDAKDKFQMKATVTMVGEKIEVEVIESEYASGPFWIITSDSTAFLNASGKKITREDIKAGDTVTVTYNGQVMMSYPPQVVAITIKKA